MKRYVLELPERIIRSVLGLGAGVTRQLGEVALPSGVRRSQLYQSLVDRTLRFLIEQVGGVEGVYPSDAALPADFAARRAAGNVVEALGLVAFHLSPVWVLAALADVCGVGRQVIPEIADAIAVAVVRTGASRTGQMVMQGLLDHYQQTLADIRRTGYAKYVSQTLRPYVAAAVRQFSPQQRTLTGTLLDRLDKRV
jgi:hypothetical protein